MILVILVGVVGLWLAGNWQPVGWTPVAVTCLLWLPYALGAGQPGFAWRWPPSRSSGRSGPPRRPVRGRPAVAASATAVTAPGRARLRWRPPRGRCPQYLAAPRPILVGLSRPTSTHTKPSVH
jgi:hypothetical protein